MPVTNLAVVGVAANSITLSFSGVAGITYDYALSTTSGTSGFGALTPLPAANADGTFTIAGLSTNVKYWVRVREHSALSNTVSATTTANPPPPPPPPPPDSFPTSASTGPASGTVFTPFPNGDDITSPGTYENFSWPQGMQILASDVTMRNCQVGPCAPSDGVGINVDPNVTNVLIENVDIIGNDPNAQVGNDSGIVMGGGASSVTVDTCRIHKWGQAVNVSGGADTLVFKNNWCGDLAGAAGSHTNGLYHGGGSTAAFSLLVDNCYFGTGIMIEDAFGKVYNLTIQNSWAFDDGVTVECDCKSASNGVFNVKFLNNTLKNPSNGWFGLDPGGGTFQVTRSGNVDAMTGQNIDNA